MVITMSYLLSLQDLIFDGICDGSRQNQWGKWRFSMEYPITVTRYQLSNKLGIKDNIYIVHLPTGAGTVP